MGVNNGHMFNLVPVENIKMAWIPTPLLTITYRPRLLSTAPVGRYLLGGSNLGRIAKAAAENGHMTVDLAAGGMQIQQVV